MIAPPPEGAGGSGGAGGAGGARYALPDSYAHQPAYLALRAAERFGGGIPGAVAALDLPRERPDIVETLLCYEIVRSLEEARERAAGLGPGDAPRPGGRRG
jgi:hypothetical protein